MFRYCPAQNLILGYCWWKWCCSIPGRPSPAPGTPVPPSGWKTFLIKHIQVLIFCQISLSLVFVQISPDLQLQLQQPGLLGDEGEGAQTPLSEKIGKRLPIKLIFLTSSILFFLGRQTCSDYLIVHLDIFSTRLIEEGGIQILLTLLLSGTGNLENNPRPVKESSVRMRQLGLEVGELLSHLV